jgi:hypothetical protein
MQITQIPSQSKKNTQLIFGSKINITYVKQLFPFSRIKKNDLKIPDKQNFILYPLYFHTVCTMNGTVKEKRTVLE